METTQTETVEQRTVREYYAVTHADDWIAVATWGDWHERVPHGYYGVAAVRGRDMADYRTAYPRRSNMLWFLVRVADYRPITVVNGLYMHGHIVNLGTALPWFGSAPQAAESSAN